MGQKFRDEAGHIWEMGPDGQPHLVQPAQVASPFADPRLGPQTVKAQNEAAASQYAPSTAASESQIKAADAANATTLAQAQRDKAVADARAAEANAKIAGVGPKLDASTRAAAIQGYSYANQLQQTIDDLTTLFNAGPGATQGVEGLKDYLPTTANQAFDTKANAARGIVAQTLGFTGGQLNTEKEAEKAVGPYLPQAGDRDAVILQKIKTLQDLADSGRAKATQVLGGVPDANGNVHPVENITPSTALPPSAGQDPTLITQSAGGKTRDVIDPALRVAGAQVGKMLANGTPDAQIIQFLQQSGVDPASTNINQGLQFRRSPDFKKWQRANPGTPFPIGPEFYTKKVPMSDARSLLNKVSATNAGGDAAAFLGASANAISGGRLDNLSSDPAMAQMGMDLLRGQHPASSFAGDLAGQASMEALAGTVPGARALMATKWGRRAADLGYGAYSGSGEGEDPLTGALTGAVTNLGGGMFGRAASRGLGRVATGVKNAHLSYLNDAGVPLTVGQIGRGSENIVGNMIGGTEERLAGMPVSDAIINQARKRGDLGFNQAAFREMGADGTGAAGLRSGQQVVDNAYSFLDPLRIPTDVPFERAQAGIHANLSNLPAFGREVGMGLDKIDNVSAGGQFTGRDWQSALRATKANRSSIAGQPFAGDAQEALSGVENNLVDLANRQVTGPAAGQLGKANKLNAQLQTLAGALDNGPAQKQDELFSAGRLDDVARANARNFGGRIKSLTGNRPFYDLTSAGKAVMPNLTPDSGTAGRAILYSGLLGLGGGGAGAGIGALASEDQGDGAGKGALTGLALGSLLAAPYSKTGQKALQKALLAERPKAVEQFGRFLLSRAPRYAGMFGSSAGRDYVYQPELYLPGQ